MHNFSVPSTLKLWIDQITWGGKTFTYTSAGPKGLLKNKKATFVVASGGFYGADTSMAALNFVEPYLRSTFGFLGVTDTIFINAGGGAAVRTGKTDRETFLQPHLEFIRAAVKAAWGKLFSISPTEEKPMKIASAIARILLGVIFLVFGSNTFLNFIPAPPLTGPLGQFAGALSASHYIYAVGLFQVVPAILLLVNRYVPLGLALLAPVIVNICFVHIFMAPDGLPLAALVVILWSVTAYPVRSAFFPLFQQKVRN
jgi:hypothetical protein